MKKYLIFLSLLFSFLFIGNVKAISSETIKQGWNTVIEGTISNNLVYHKEDFPYVYCNNTVSNINCYFLPDYTFSYQSSEYIQLNSSVINSYLYAPGFSYNSNTNNFTFTHANNFYFFTASYYSTKQTNFDIYNGSNKIWSKNLDYSVSSQNFTVNFHLNGGSVIDFSDILNPITYTDDYTKLLDISDLDNYLGEIYPSKENYTFDGWYYDENFTELYDGENTLNIDFSESFNSENLLDNVSSFPGYLNSWGMLNDGYYNVPSWTTDFISIDSSKEYVFTYDYDTAGPYNSYDILCYDSSKNLVSTLQYVQSDKNYTISFSNSSISFIRIVYSSSFYDMELSEPSLSSSNSSIIDLYAKWDLYDYLKGYKKIDLTTNDKYLMISDITSGSVFIPTQDFEQYGGRVSYYDNDLDIQPYTSYIQDYNKTPDGKFVRQDFNLDNYVGADWVMFSKYIYLEGEDNISYSIWVPDTSYDSQVSITPNIHGGNDFDFTYKDSNGDIQNGRVQSEDLSQDSPLLGNVFEDFSSNTFGLTSIITSPLSLISSLSTKVCRPLELPLPFIGGILTLPCMYSFYSSTFGELFTLYQTITFGIVSYWVIVRIFNMVKDFKSPEHDEIEVIDL